MPVTTEKYTYDEMRQKVRAGWLCAECGALLSVAWGGAYKINGHILRCTKDVKHDGIAKPYELTAFQLADGLQIGNMSSLRRRKLVQQLGETTGTALAPYAGKGWLSEVEAKTVVSTLWPKAPLYAVQKAIMICAQYGANPLRKHLHLVEFGGKWEVIEGIDFARLAVRRKIPYTYLEETPRLMTEAEEIRVFRKVNLAKNRAICILKDLVTGITVRGYGEYIGNPYGSDKGNNPENMSMIRAERNALKKLAPDALPDDVKVGDGNYVITAEGEKVDIETGEIKDPYTQASETNQTNPIDGDFTEDPGTFEPDPGKAPVESASNKQVTATVQPQPAAGEAPPPARNESPVTNDQIIELTKLGEERGQTLKHIGYRMNHDLKWNIGKFPDLKVWQFEELKAWLNSLPLKK